MALAGTDPWHHARYADAAEEQRRMMQRVLNEDIMLNSREGETYLAGAELWGRIPPLEYAGPPVGWALQSQTRAGVALLFWLALAGLLMRRGLITLGRRV
jgi:ABC-2 type transport system permease protein